LVQDSALAASERAALAGALLQTRLTDSLPVIVGRIRGHADVEEFQRDILGSLAAVDSPRVPEEILRHYAELRPSLRPQAIDLLTSRPAWARLLLDAVAGQRIASMEVNLIQVRKIIEMKNANLSARAEQIWGKVRAQRNPDREKVIARMKGVLATATGDPKLGERVFRNVCAQCHTIHGFGNAVGPDLTKNGRNTLDLLLSNVLDPNQVIGKEYQAHLVETTKGRLMSGLLVENSPQRVVLKVPGGKTEVIPRAEVAEMQASAISLMPEGLEQQMTQQEFVDLIAYLQQDVARQ
jgi:putative heme-binding domain-containing protein